jgi:hypothetical protein
VSDKAVVKVMVPAVKVVVGAPGPQGPPGPPGSGNTVVNAGDGLSATGSGTVGSPRVLAVDGTVIRTGNAALTNARTPTAHKATHATGGTDALTPADIGAAAASHTHNASAIAAGTLALTYGGTGRSDWASVAIPPGRRGIVTLEPGTGSMVYGVNMSASDDGVLYADEAELGQVRVMGSLDVGGVSVLLANEARVPAASGTTGHVWTKTAGGFAWQAPTGGGSVTSVALSLPAIFSVSGSPVTGSGTLAATLANQTARTFWAGPTSGGAAAPAFRALALTDLPAGSSAGEVLYWGGSAWAAQQLAHASLTGLLVDDHTQYLHLDPSSTGRNEVQPGGNVPGLEIVAPAGGYTATTTLFRVSTHDGTHLFRAHRNHGTSAWELTFSQRPTIGGSQIALVSDLIGLDNGGTGQGDWGTLDDAIPVGMYGLVSLEKDGTAMALAQGMHHDGVGGLTVGELITDAISVAGEAVVTDGPTLQGSRQALVRVATTANITLSGTQTIDGVAVVANDLVLVKDQSTGSQNGVYLVQAGAWVRTLMTTTQQMRDRLVVVTAGTVNGGSIWQCVTSNPTVGTTATLWSRVNSSRLRFLSNNQTNFEQFVINGAGETLAFPGTVNYYVYQVTNSDRIVLSNDAANASTTGEILVVRNGTSFGSGGSKTLGFHAPSGGWRRRVVTGTGSTNSAMGRANLAGGTVTITNTHVAAGDLIRVTRLSVSGTPGHLSVGTITAGTSFVLNSSDASDAGEVLWEIIRPA